MIQNKIIHIRSLIKVLLLLLLIGTLFISPVNAIWDNSYLSVINSNISNGVRYYQFNLTLHTGTGTNNATDVFGGTNLTFNWINNTHANINFNITVNNETDLPFWIENISMNNQSAKIWINVTQNGSVQIFGNGTNYTYNNTQRGNLTFDNFNDFEFYNSGTLNGQDGWSDSNGWYTISSVNTYGGLYSMNGTVIGASAPAYAIKNLPLTMNNIILEGQTRFVSGASVSIGSLNAYEGGIEIARLIIDNTGQLYDNVGALGYTLTSNKTYKMQLIVKADNTHDIRVFDDTTQVLYLTSRVNTAVMAVGINQIRTYHDFRFNYGSLDNVIVRRHDINNQTWSSWGNWENNAAGVTISIYNNVTADNTHNFSVLGGRGVNFSVNTSGSKVDSYIWSLNGANITGCTGISCIQTITAVYNNITINASNSTGYGYDIDYWNVTGLYYSLELQQPLNTSTGVLTPVTLYWRQWLPAAPHTWQISTDYQFINIVTSGSATSTTENFSSGAVSLSNATKYYWRARNATGSWSGIFEFTTSSTPATPGQINATVFDEQNYSIRITNFTAQLYNSTTMITKNTTTGWANFSSAEVSSGQYLLRIVPNSSYASRNILVTSPTNATVYLPSTTNTINTIAFYLMDYTTLYPWTSSILSITKNNSVMHSSYFDADAKVAVYLIQGDSYGVTITNGNNIHNWGNYISVASGNVEVVVTDIAVNATSTIPFGYNLSHSTTDITLSWRSNVTLGDLNFTILKNNSELVHQLITTIPVGQSQYIVTDLNSTYYVYLTVNNNDYVRREVINYRAGSLRSDCGLGLGCRIMWGSGESRFELPQWMYNSIIVFLIWILAGSFGALFAAFGAVVTVIFTALFWYWGWLEGTTLGAAFVGAIAILVIIDYLRSRE